MENPSQTAALAGGDNNPVMPDLSGRTLGDYHLLRRLGQGGMGQVYLAEQISLKRKVALKILRPDLAANPISLQRFKNEAEAVARVTHANIVQVYQIGEAEGMHYMALEYVEGRNLREYVARKGPPELLVALSIMRQVAAALQRAGELGIIHRDIKPENILLTRKGEVKVADFGLSRCLAPDQQPLNLTASGVTMGTPLYMAPEQVQGKPVDPRTDIYSLGVTCYHMFTGQPPFKGSSPFEVALQHVQAQPVPLQTIRPDLPPDLCAIVHKMMAKEPDQRYQTGRDLLRDLAKVREALNAGAPMQTQMVSLDSVSGVTAPQPSPTAGTAATTVLPPQRNWAPWLVAGSLLLALIGGVALGWWRMEGSGPSTQPPGSGVADNPDAVEAMFSLQKREQFLKQAVKQYANPGRDTSQIQLGLGHCLELALFYLDQWRLQDAETLFNSLEGSEVRAYKGLGKLGQGIVLGLNNQPAESNKIFLELLVPQDRNPDRTGLYILLNRNPKLKQWVVTALDYNAANATLGSPFPQELAPYRTVSLKPWPPERSGPRPGGM